MRLIRPAIVLAVAALCGAVFVLGGCGKPLSPFSYDELTKQAKANIKKAEVAKVNGDKIDYYTKAITNYQDAVGRAVNDRDQRQEARAYYSVATTSQALAKIYPEIGQQNGSLWTAHGAYTTIVSKYGTNTESFPAEVQEIVRKARVEVTLNPRHTVKTVADELDRRNSEYKLFGVVNLYKVIDTLVKLTGSVPAFSYWFAVILITIIVKLLLTPLTKAQFKAMKEMQKVAPLVKEIQEKHKGDQQTIGAKTMELYKEHHINPFASCLPLLIQMPILLMLYQIIRMYQFQFERGAFLWIGSALSHMTSVTVPFGAGGQVWVTARNLAEPDLILVLLYTVSMYVSTKLSNVDPTQAEQQKMMAILMPVMFAFLFAGFQSAFLLYWLVFNVIQTAQQYLILHKHGEPLPVAAPVPPAKPKDDTPRQPRRRRRR